MGKKSCIVVVLLVLAGGAAAIWFFYGGGSNKHIRNVLLISMDTTRADYLSCYGYKRKTTPNIDALAAEGIRCEKVISTVPLTLPAHSSIMTGTNPPYHGVHGNTDYQLNEDNVTLAEILKDQGFATGAVISAFVMNSKFNLDQGFDTYNDQFQQKHSIGTINERKGDEATQVAIQWLDDHKASPFFYFLHYFDPHSDYEPPEPFATEYHNNPYAGEIAFTDHCIGKVVDKLKELDLYESTLIIIVGDHGEMLGEHEESSHGYYIYEGAVKVPLVFKVTGNRKAKTIESNVGVIDIVPTVCSLLGIDPPEHIAGIDLSPFFKKGQPPADRPIYCESLLPTLYNANSLLGIVEGRHKYIQTTKPELYDLKEDPRESINLVNTRPQRARILQDKLAQVLEEQVRSSSDDSRTNLDAEAVKRLESLGYVAGKFSEDFSFDRSKRNPRELLQLHLGCSYATHFIRKEMYEDAKRTLKKLDVLYPGHSMVYNKLGEVAVKTEDYDSAVRYLKLALQSQPKLDKVKLYNLLGSALIGRGEYDEAAEISNKALRLEPDHPMSLKNLANVLLQQGHFDKSIEYFLRIEPAQPVINRIIADIYYKQDKLAEAAHYYQAALKLKHDMPLVHNSLAEIHHGRGDLDKAVEHWRQALEIRPDWIGMLNNLAWWSAAYKNKDFHNPDEAVRLANRACQLTDHKNPDLLDTLSVAYAAAGKFTDAVDIAEKAITIADAAGKKELADSIRKRLKMFKASQAYYEDI